MKNRLLVPEVTNFMDQYREEIAQEFGIFHSAQQIDAQVDMTKGLIEKRKERKIQNETKKRI